MTDMSDALDRALREMKATKRPGLVLVVPDDLRFTLGEFSESLKTTFAFGSDCPADGRAVFACARASEVLARFGEAPALLALSPDGRPSGSHPGPLDALLGGDSLRKAVGQLLGPASGPRAPARLPFGVEWAEASHRSLFGTNYDPCPACGMPSVDANEAELIRYLRLLE